MRRIRILVLVLLAAFVAPAAAQFNFGVSPSSIVEDEPHGPGDTFYGRFFVISSSDEDIDISIASRPGALGDLRTIKPGAARNFSAQPCEGCIEFLQYDSRLTERDRALDEAGTIRRWEQIEFFVNLPEDIEPGYHLLELTPHPERAGPGGSVGLVSTASVPVVFHVPGEVVRSGRVIGIRTGDRTLEEQELEATFYNTGTVTMQVNARFIIPGDGENVTYAAGSGRIAPGEETRFSAMVDAHRLNTSTPVTATVSYRTGEAAVTRPVQARREVTVTGRAEQAAPYGMYLFLVLFLVVSSLVTRKVIRRAR